MSGRLAGMSRFLYIYCLVAFYLATMAAWYLDWTPLLLGLMVLAQMATVGWVGINQRMVDPVLFAAGFGMSMPALCAFGSDFSLFGTVNVLLAAALGGMFVIRMEMAYQTRQRGRALGLG